MLCGSRPAAGGSLGVPINFRAEQGPGADRANGSLVPGGCRLWRGGSGLALGAGKAPSQTVKVGFRKVQETIMQVDFVTSVSVISATPAASRKLYVDALNLPLKRLDGEYFATEQLEGVRHFGVWPLAQAAEACFGTDVWPKELPIPQVSIEFELKDAEALAAAVQELESDGFKLLHGAKTEPWGQIVARLLTVDGVIVGLSYAPSLHEKRKS